MAVFTESERVEVWDRRQAGESNRSIGRRLGRSAASIRAFVEASGGVRPAVRRRSVRQLSLVEREEISRGVAAGESLRVVAHRLGRAPSTLSREVARNGGAAGIGRIARTRRRGSEPGGRRTASWLRTMRCGPWWRSCLPSGGRRNRSQGGWPARTLATRRCTCHTRRSI